MTEIYWLTRLNGIFVIFVITFLISTIFCFGIVGSAIIDDGLDGISESFKKTKGVLIAFVVSLLGIVLTPNQ